MPVLRRAAALAAALEDRRSVCVAGTHGKTTTTSLLTVAAQACGLDPSFAIGGNLYETGRNAHLGSGGPGSLAIVEADESDGSFLLTRPGRGDRHQRGGRPPGEPRRSRRDLPRVRAVRRPGRRPTGCCWPAPTTPGARRIAEYARAGGRRGAAPTASARHADVRVTDVGVAAQTASTFTVAGPGVGDRAGRGRRADRAAHGAQRRGRAGHGRASSGSTWTPSSRVVGELRRRAPPLRVPRRGRRRAGVRRLRPPPDRDRRVARSRARSLAASRRPADRGVPARHLQPHPDLRRASSPRRWRSPTSRS